MPMGLPHHPYKMWNKVTDDKILKYHAELHIILLTYSVLPVDVHNCIGSNSPHHLTFIDRRTSHLQQLC